MIDRSAAGHLLALTVVLVAGACGGGGAGASGTPTAASAVESSSVAPAPVGTVAVSKSECTLQGVDGPISAGAAAFTVVNEAGDEAYLDMGSIPDGHTFEELAAVIEKSRQRAEAGRPEIPRPSWLGSGLEAMVEAGESGTMSGSLLAGTYGIICLRFYSQVGEPRPNGVAGPVKVE